jgi:hypothetical protein
MIHARYAYFIFGVGAMLAFAIFISQYSQNLHDGLVNSCNRVNALRAQSNLSDSVSFNILSGAAQREFVLAKLSKGKRMRVHRRSGLEFVHEARKLKVTSPTNCNLAVNHPRDYRYPIPHALGDPLTGKLNPDTLPILRASAALIAKQTKQRRP